MQFVMWVAETNKQKNLIKHRQSCQLAGSTLVLGLRMLQHTAMATASATPVPRSLPFVASAGNLAYVWGGEGDTEPGAVFIYSDSEKTKTWTRKVTKGQHPPTGLRDGACCIADQHFYLYGGSYLTSYHGALFQLNMADWSWKELSNCSPEGPGKKAGCRMVAYKHKLVIVGGDCGKGPSSTQAGSDYDHGKTNEVHSYSLATVSLCDAVTDLSHPPEAVCMW